VTILSNTNLYAHFEANFPQDRSACAIEVPSLSKQEQSALYYTWSDVDRATAKLANLLASLNLPAGARIAVQTEKSVEALMLYLATLRAGYVYLPLNTAYQSSEMEYFIGNAEPSVVVCSPKSFSWMAKLAFTAGAVTNTVHVFTLGDMREGSLLQRAAACSDVFKTAHLDASDMAAILYTSGTTGRSKGAMLSHGNLLSNALTLKKAWHWRNDKPDVLLHALPIFHVHGLFVASHCALLSGSKMLWMDKFDAARAVQLLPRATVFMGVPTLYTRLLTEKGFNTNTCKRIRLFVSGSAPMLLDTFDSIKKKTSHTILERYGMSETVMLTSNPYKGTRKGGTVGQALEGVQVRVTNEEGWPITNGDVGNIEVKGANVFSGYWRMPEKTAEEFTLDGFFKTGDVGKIDAQGYVTIVGRSKDLIITGGYNVYPAEIEAYLNDVPGVAESAAIGVPHADFGEAVIAVVVAKPGTTLKPDEIIATMKKSIANFKVPKRVFIVNELPRNAMGKVQKNVLRELHTGLFA
jgi:malonyl-CoA/methylmalonyl-CoA synthetase